LANDKFLNVNDRLSTEDGHYAINTVSDFKELLAFGQDSSLKFKLNNDLDLAAESDFYIPYLAGEFDGNGHRISNLSFNFDFVSHVGLFGYIDYLGKVSRVDVDNVDISGCHLVGGLAGFCRGIVSNSCSSGSIAGTYNIGGLAGDNSGAVSNSHSTGGVIGDYFVGGLVGRNSGSVSHSYSAGSVIGVGYVGGLVGIQSTAATVTDSFWDTETSGQSNSAGGTGKNTSEMMDIATFTDTATEGLDQPWNMIAIDDPEEPNPSYTWNIVDGQTYPFLTWGPVVDRPSRPYNLSPEDSTTNVSTMPILVSSEFEHPNEEAEHIATQWRIRTESGNYGEPVFSTETTVALTMLPVPSDVLAHSTSYFWQVRHKDSHGVWSEWSQETSFTTLEQPYVAFEVVDSRSGYVFLDASASESRHPHGEIAFYDWDISEDEYAIRVIGETPQLDASWLAAGTYTVTLRVGDNRGGVSTIQQTVEVSESWYDRLVSILLGWFGYVDGEAMATISTMSVMPQWAKWRFYSDWKDLADIDAWLRYDEGTRLDWTTRQPEDIVYVLNKDIVEGLTYREAIKIVTEQELVANEAFATFGTSSYAEGCPAVNKYIKYLGWEAATSVLTSGVVKLLELGWKIELFVEALGICTSIPGWLEIAGEMNQARYQRFVGYYFAYREGVPSYDQVWREQARGGLGIVTEEDLATLAAHTDSLYDYFDPHKCTGGLCRDYRDDIRTEVKHLILELLKEYKDELPSRQKWYKGLMFWNPAELRLYDSDGNVAGLVDGEIIEEIENAVFLPEEDSIAFYGPMDLTRVELVGTNDGDYILSGYWQHEGAEVLFAALDIPTTPGQIHKYTVDWDALAQGDEGVTVQVDSDGDGTFERTFTSDSELTRNEFLSQSGCFIATAAYGTTMADEVQTLRDFRDQYLLTNPSGQAFVDLYYRTSPPIAEFITDHPGLKPIVRAGLVPAVAISTVVVNTTQAQKIAILGLLMLVSAAVAIWATRRRGRWPESG
ncbi:MAG: CFI-box-CTERM domain-containing protein, partial [Dehalococcoidia bacterium]